MTRGEATEILRRYNEWRRYDGAVGKGPEMTDPTQLGIAIATVVAAMEEAYPESKEESEDERIRKGLIKYLESDRDCQPCQDVSFYDEALAYLERHIEQKPIQYDIDVLEKHITKDSVSELAHTVIVRNGWEIVEKEQMPAELDSLAKPMTHKEWAEDYWEHHKFASPNGNDKCDVIQFGHKGFIDFCIAYCVDQKPQDRLVLHDTFAYEKGRQVGQSEGVKMVLETPESYGLYKPAEWSKNDTKIQNCL